MKKQILMAAILALAFNVFATGNEGVNPPQSGVISGTNAVGGIPLGYPNVTNTFAFPYQTVPLVVIYCSATNGTPITNNFVTTTNFSFSFAAPGTNDSYAWQSFVGGTRMQSGTQAVIGTLGVTNVTFPIAYATPPIVVVSGNNTNFASSVAAVTATNFTIWVGGNSTNQWISVGTVATPQSEYQGNYPVSNKVLY